MPDTTKLCYVNRNSQVVIRKTTLPRTDHNSAIIQIGYGLCGEVYGANLTDVHERRFPKCQGGKPGSAYEDMPESKCQRE